MNQKAKLDFFQTKLIYSIVPYSLKVYSTLRRKEKHFGKKVKYLHKYNIHTQHIKRKEGVESEVLCMIKRDQIDRKGERERQ